jgi:hypothetical protein
MDSHIWPTFCCSYRIDSYTLFHGFFCRRNKVTAETVWVSWTADGIGNQTSYSIMHQGIEGSGLFHGMDTKWRGTTRSMMQWWGSIITCPIDFLSPRFTHSYDLDWCAARAQQCLLGKKEHSSNMRELSVWRCVQRTAVPIDDWITPEKEQLNSLVMRLIN